MKITEEKHNHKVTNLLKVFIFSILMLLPFINIGVRCAYVTFNKNAYQSAEITQTTYSRTPKYEHGDIANTDIEIGKLYELDFNNNTTDECFNMLSQDFELIIVPIQIYEYSFAEYSINGTDVVLSGNSTNNDNSLTFKLKLHDTVTSFDLYLCDPENNDYFMSFEILPLIEEPFIFHAIVYFEVANNIELYSSQTIVKNTTYQEYNYEEIESTTLDNVFEYSLNKLENEQYLTWTQNTAVYTGVNAMTTGLGITQTVIPMLIVYWFMLTIIYIIIDIVLTLFTKLTHMIGNKTT